MDEIKTSTCSIWSEGPRLERFGRTYIGVHWMGTSLSLISTPDSSNFLLGTFLTGKPNSVNFLKLFHPAPVRSVSDPPLFAKFAPPERPSRDLLQSLSCGR